MTIHLLQFRFGETQNYLVRPPPYLIYFWGITKLQLFWTDDENVQPVPVRDIYKLEFDRFLGSSMIWSFYYIFSTSIFVIHATLGWNKLIYISFPLFVIWTRQVACGKAMVEGQD